jgi:hypothetical protein
MVQCRCRCSPSWGRFRRYGAGWSSPVAREAHNLEVAGSNPVPASEPNAAKRGDPLVNDERRGRPSSAFAFYRQSAQGFASARPGIRSGPPLLAESSPHSSCVLLPSAYPTPTELSDSLSGFPRRVMTGLASLVRSQTQRLGPHSRRHGFRIACRPGYFAVITVERRPHPYEDPLRCPAEPVIARSTPHTRQTHDL